MTHFREILYRLPVRGMIALVASVFVAGCGMSNFTSGLGGGLFGGSEKPTIARPVSEAQLLNDARTNDTVQLASSTGVKGCPKFVVWPRDRNLTVYEGGQEGDGLAIVQRGEITKTARECQVSPGQVSIRYGFSGRVLLGPRGKPGNYVLPFRVFVTDYKREILQTQKLRISVVVPETTPISYFSKVGTVTFAVPQGVRPDDFKLFVAFEQPPKKSG